MTKQSNYLHGRDFEHTTRHDLEENGYWVMRAAGSKTKVDLIAVKAGQILLVQCKRNGKVGPAERKEIIRIADMINFGRSELFFGTLALPLVAYKITGRAKPLYDRLHGPAFTQRQPYRLDQVADAVGTTDEGES